METKKLSYVLKRCLGSLVILIFSQAVASIWYSFSLFGLEYLLNTVTYIGLTYFLVRYFFTKKDPQALKKMRIGRFQVKKEWLALALLLPLGVLAAFYFLIPGQFVNNNYSLEKDITIFMLGFFSTGLAAGVVEELIFRGVIMSTIEKQYGLKWAIFLPSVLFGALHLLNGQLNFVSALLLISAGTLVGVMFSLLAYFNQSIWASMLIHFVWNAIIIGGICNFGVAKDLNAITSYILKSQNFILTGGEFGIETSLFAIIGYAAIISYLLIRKKTAVR